MKESAVKEACIPSCHIAQALATERTLIQKLDAIIDSSFDGLWICDGDGRVVRINRASEKLNDIKAEQVVGKTMQTLIKEGFIDRSVTLEVVKNRTAITAIQRLKNGRQLLVTGNPVFDEHGNLDRVVVNERDMTNLIHLRNELEESRALASRYRSELNQMANQQELLSTAVIQSEVMRRAFGRAMKVAEVDSTVLIRGASGVGKGYFANFIHRASPRRDGPFVRVDCGAIPNALIESELFGYEKGAFSGALSSGKIGLLELAEGGAVFLDEIGDLPLSVQVKILRFLDDNEIVRVGGTKFKRLNVRVIAATHRDLEAMVSEGVFRKDLFFRLNVIPLHIPELRERADDIPPLVGYFLDHFNKKYGTQKSVTQRAMDCLRRYPFAGNIRELSNIVEQLAVLSSSDCIEMEDLPDHIRAVGAITQACPVTQEWNLEKAVRLAESIVIRRALKRCGSQRKAARLLGINQSTLARKVKRYGIRVDAFLHSDEIMHHLEPADNSLSE